MHITEHQLLISSVSPVVRLMGPVAGLPDGTELLALSMYNQPTYGSAYSLYLFLPWGKEQRWLILFALLLFAHLIVSNPTKMPLHLM